MLKKILLGISVLGLFFLLFAYKPNIALGDGETKNICAAQLLPNGDIALLYTDSGEICCGFYQVNTKTWQSQKIAPGSQGALAIEKTGKAHIAYINSEDNLVYISQTASGWSEPEIIESLNWNDIPGKLSYPSIAADNEGFVHISYHDSAGGYFFFNDYAPYDKEDLIYATNAGGSFTKTVISYSDGWEAGAYEGQTYAFPPSQMASYEGNCYLGNFNYTFDKYPGGQDYTYKYNIYNIPEAIGHEYLLKNTNTPDNTIALLAAKAGSEGIYALYQAEGRLYINKDGITINQGERSFSPIGAGLALDSSGEPYYAAANEEGLLLYQNGAFKEGLVLPENIGAKSKLLTLVNEDTQYIFYASQGGRLLMGLNSLTPGDLNSEWLILGEKRELSLEGIEIDNKNYDKTPIIYTGPPLARDDEGNIIIIGEYTYTYKSADDESYLSNEPPYKAGKYKLIIEISEADSQYKGKIEIDFEINPKPISALGILGQEKSYDGNCQIALTGGALEGVLPGDDVSLVLPAWGLSGNAAAEDNKIILPQGEPSLAGKDASNYILFSFNEIRGDIKKAALEINKVNLYPKIYNGNNQGLVESIEFKGLKNGESLVLGLDYTASAEFAHANAGININISAGLSLNPTDKAANYLLAEDTFAFLGDILKGDGLIAQGESPYILARNTLKGYTYDLSSLIFNKEDTGEIIYKIGDFSGDELFSQKPALGEGGIMLEFTALSSGYGEARQSILIESRNYTDINFLLDFCIAPKTEITLKNIFIEDKIYDAGPIAFWGSPMGEAGGNDIIISEYSLVFTSTGGADYNSPNPPVDAGDYKLNISIPEDNPDYEGSLEIPFKITKRELLLSPKSYTVYENAPLPILEYEISGLAEGDNLNEVIELIAGGLELEVKNALGERLENTGEKGEYAIVFKNAPQFYSKNYSVNILSGSLIIKAKPSAPPLPGTGGAEINSAIPAETDSEGNLILLPKVLIKNNQARLILSPNEINKIPAGAMGINKIIISPDIPKNTEAVYLEISRQAFAALARVGEKILLKTDLGYLALNMALFAPALDENWQHLSLSLKKGEDSSLIIECITDGRILNNFNGLWAVLPFKDISPSLILIFINDKGESQIIPKAFAVSNGLAGPLKGSGKIKIAVYRQNFKDISLNHWAKEYIDFTASRRLFEGMSEGIFGAGAPLNRGMLLTVLHRLEGQEKPVLKAPLYDIEESPHYASGLNWAFEKGLIAGYPGGRFLPLQNINREELAVIIFNYSCALGLNTSPAKGDISGFKDGENIAPWAKAAFEYLIGEGIIEGRGGNLLAPKEEISRGELAAILYRLIPLLNNSFN